MAGVIVAQQRHGREGHMKTEAPLTRYRTLPRTAADYYCHQT
jgi:hypothetical protein